MAFYVVSEDTTFSGQLISEKHFGVNLVTIYDEEFVDPGSELAENVQQLGASTLRFPGGSATENYFDMRQPDLAVSVRDPSQTLTPMDQFFARAGEIGTAVTIVIPTQMAFELSAAEAMLAGTYGQRQEVSAAYLQDVADFVATAVDYANANGVQISAFEIGNEFWGSGEMAAAEYGVVAGEVAALLSMELAALGVEEAEIIAQTTSSASRLYSSRNPVEAYVGTIDGELRAFTQADIDSTFDGTVPDGWQQVTVEGQGSARAQVSQIAEGINSVVGAADAVDGLVQHYYQSGGFAKADGTKSFKFSQFGRLEDQLDRSPDSPELSYHITEWNTNATGAVNNRGLQNASMMVENFFELVANDVDVAQIWPLSFDAAQGISLVDLDGPDLSISGEMFRLMAESLPGSTPVLDWSVTGMIDIHGFERSNGTVFFVSERGGSGQNNIELDVSQFLSTGSYFMTQTQLWDGGAGGDDASAAPVVSDVDGGMVQSTTLSFDLDSWANLRVEVIYVGEGDDTLTGRGGADTIKSFGGADQIRAGDGADTIDAGIGDDDIWGEAGDDIIIGGVGNDMIDGGEGFDTALYSAPLDTFSVVFDAHLPPYEAFHILDANGDMDEIRKVEALAFADQTVSVELLQSYLDEVTQEGAAPPVEPVFLQRIVDGPDPVAPLAAQMEIGRVSIEQLNADYWQSVSFSEEISDAVVVMGPASSEGGQPLTIRVRNVTETGFEFQIDEWDHLDGYHLEEHISWMAGTRGDHALTDGSKISFGAFEASALGDMSVNLNEFEEAPFVFGQVAGDAEARALAHRIENVSQTGFDAQLQLEEANAANVLEIAPSTFYFAALDVAEDSFIFNMGTQAISNRFESIGVTLGPQTGFFADMQTVNDHDPSTLRYDLNSEGELVLRVREERSLDREIRHADEDVAWFMADEGVYDFV